MKIHFEIDKLINGLIKQLPGVKLVGYEERPRLELWNVTVTHYAVPVYQKIDHRHKLRVAWNAKGPEGLLRYIEPYVKPASLAKVRRIILAIERQPITK